MLPNSKMSLMNPLKRNVGVFFGGVGEQDM